MALRDTLKDYIPLKVWQVIARSDGAVITADRWNELFNLLITQGDDTTAKLKDTLSMLYETVLSDTDGASHINLTDAAFTATDVKAVLLELANRISTNLANLTAVDQGIQAQVTSNDADIANGVSALNTHKTSGDHDGRYFTEGEVTALLADIQNQINSNDADLVAVNALITALNNTYSTDLERIQAIAQVVADYEAADNNLTSMLASKANSADHYTKAQIDSMTLGAYKMDITNKDFRTVSPVAEISVDVAGFNPDFDSLQVWRGGRLMTKDQEWEYNVTKDAFKPVGGGNWPTDTDFDWLVIRNLRVLLPSDQFDGSLVTPGTLPRAALASVVIAELDQLRAKVDTKAEVLYGTGTIPNTGWVANTGDYALTRYYARAELLATDWIELVLDKDAHDIATDAELCPTVEEYLGGFKLFANKVPTEAIPFKWKVVR